MRCRAQRSKLAGLVDDMYELFVTRAAAARGMSRDELHDVAKGRVWTGAEAIERGLVRLRTNPAPPAAAKIDRG